MGKNYNFDENGVGVKEFYTKVIGNGPETVVVIVYKGLKYEHHFYRPGGETGLIVKPVPRFFHPQIGVELRKKGMRRASDELRARTPGPMAVREEDEVTDIPQTWHHKYGIAG